MEHIQKQATSQTPPQSESSSADSPSMNQILQSIRDVISGIKDNISDDTSDDIYEEVKRTSASVIPIDAKNKRRATTTKVQDDVLELTDIVEDSYPNASNIANQSSPSHETPKKKMSVLDHIDKALEDFNQSANRSETDATKSSQQSQPLPNSISQPSPHAELASPTPPYHVNQSHPHESRAYPSHVTPSLLSKSASESSKATLKQLMGSLPKSSDYASQAALEHATTKAIEPFIAAWLDENLPDIVERIVEKEIKQLILQSTS